MRNMGIILYQHSVSLFTVLFAALFLTKTNSTSHHCYGFSDHISDSCSCNAEFLNHVSGMGRIGNAEECSACYYGVGFSISFKCELCPANSSSLQGDRFCICNPGFAQSSSYRVPVCTWLEDQTEYVNSTLSSPTTLAGQSPWSFYATAASDDGMHVYGLSISTTGMLFYSTDGGKNFQDISIALKFSATSNKLTLEASGDGKFLFLGGAPGPLVTVCFDEDGIACPFGAFMTMDQSVQTQSYHYTSIAVNEDASLVTAVEMARDPNTKELYVRRILRAERRQFTIFTSLSLDWMRPQHFSLASLLSFLSPSNFLQLAASVSYPNVTRVAGDHRYYSLAVRTSRSGRTVVYARENSDTTYLSYNYGNTVSHSISVPCSSTSLDMSFSGKYIYCISADYRLYRSEDFGVTFQSTHEKFRQVLVDHSGQVVLGLDAFYNLVESYDYGKTFSILTGGIVTYALGKTSYSIDNLDRAKNPDYLYITSTKQGVRYNRLKATLYPECQIGYHSPTGHGPLCVACPTSSTNLDSGQTECKVCRNGYFGINGVAPCHRYYSWLPYATISLYTTAVVMAAFFYSNKSYILKKHGEMMKYLDQRSRNEDDVSNAPGTEQGKNVIDAEEGLMDDGDDDDDDDDDDSGAYDVVDVEEEGEESKLEDPQGNVYDSS